MNTVVTVSLLTVAALLTVGLALIAASRRKAQAAHLAWRQGEAARIMASLIPSDVSHVVTPKPDSQDRIMAEVSASAARWRDAR